MSRNRKLWTKAQRESVHAITYGRCFYCLAPVGLDCFALDHFIPIARGGPDHISNMVPACFECNHSKGSMMPWAWFEWSRRTTGRLDTRSVYSIRWTDHESEALRAMRAALYDAQSAVEVAVGSEKDAWSAERKARAALADAEKTIRQLETDLRESRGRVLAAERARTEMSAQLSSMLREAPREVPS